MLEGQDDVDIDDRYYARVMVDRPPSDFIGNIPSLEFHAVYGSLRREGLIERFDVYQRRDVVDDANHHRLDVRMDDLTPPAMSRGGGGGGMGRRRRNPIVVVRVKLGNKLNGHPGIIHGGILSLLFDEAIGCACECLMIRQRDDGDGRGDDNAPAVTAYLNVTYRTSLPESSMAYIRVYIDGDESSGGRKMYFHATLGDSMMDGRGILYAEANCLYVRVRSSL
jgi:acyl-coenzyme A thioesterase PaaI-like protein